MPFKAGCGKKLKYKLSAGWKIKFGGSANMATGIAADRELNSWLLFSLH